MSISPQDLTTRATIRQAAMQLFARHGFDAVTVRQIAAAAEVSPALVMHHFGSKTGLQAAVVERVQDWFEQMLSLTEGGKAAEALETHNWNALLQEAAQVFGAEDTLPDLLARLIADGDPAATAIVGRIIERSAQIMSAYVDKGVIAPDPEERIRAALLVASDFGTMLLRRQITESIGLDPHSPDGMQRWAEVASRVYAALFVTPPIPDRSQEKPS